MKNLDKIGNILIVDLKIISIMHCLCNMSFFFIISVYNNNFMYKKYNEKIVK